MHSETERKVGHLTNYSAAITNLIGKCLIWNELAMLRFYNIF